MNTPRLVMGLDVKKTSYTGSSLSNYLSANPNLTMAGIPFSLSLSRSTSTPNPTHYSLCLCQLLGAVSIAVDFRTTSVPANLTAGLTNIDYFVYFNTSYGARTNILGIQNRFPTMDIRNNLVRRVDSAIRMCSSTLIITLT
jgi:hypothetical protein